MIWLEDGLKQSPNNPNHQVQDFLPRNWNKSQKIKTKGQGELAQKIA
jgi:hypothetical protein